MATALGLVHAIRDDGTAGDVCSPALPLAVGGSKSGWLRQQGSRCRWAAGWTMLWSPRPRRRLRGHASAPEAAW